MVDDDAGYRCFDVRDVSRVTPPTRQPPDRMEREAIMMRVNAMNVYW